MADLLTHVLAAYALATAARWRLGFDRRWVPPAMGGAALPDLVKLRLLVGPGTVESLLGLRFSYDAVPTLGGVLLLAGAVALAFDAPRRAYGFVLLGGCSALVLDGLRVFADGRAGAYLYPVTWWHPPTPGLYVSSDPRVLAVALAVAGAVALADRRLGPDGSTDDDG